MAIELLKAEWGRPRDALHRGRRCPFSLACRFAVEPMDVSVRHSLELPDSVLEFWRITRHAVLFEDQDYGQWGLEILGLTEALQATTRQRVARPQDFTACDLVLGRFLGDSDLLVIACDPDRSNFGSVMIGLPIDRRSSWPTVASSFGEFLLRFVEAQGDKYWEAGGQWGQICPFGSAAKPPVFGI